MKPIRKTTRNIIRKADKLARECFARYLVLDDYGTSQRCYTWTGVQAWLPFLSERARVVDLYAGMVVLECSTC